MFQSRFFRCLFKCAHLLGHTSSTKKCRSGEEKRSRFLSGIARLLVMTRTGELPYQGSVVRFPPLGQQRRCLTTRTSFLYVQHSRVNVFDDDESAIEPPTPRGVARSPRGTVIHSHLTLSTGYACVLAHSSSCKTRVVCCALEWIRTHSRGHGRFAAATFDYLDNQRSSDQNKAMPCEYSCSNDHGLAYHGKIGLFFLAGYL